MKERLFVAAVYGVALVLWVAFIAAEKFLRKTPKT